jgi:diaminopimelate epimerase
MKRIPFFKMSGSGNDFIFIDNRKGVLRGHKISSLVKSVCRRRFSVGADGLILIEESKKADFKWRFYNADGSEVEMCGNGARCVARFANLMGIVNKNVTFETKAGIIRAQVNGTRVRLAMSEPKDIVLDYHLTIDGKKYSVSHVNTGVPHVVMFVDDLEGLDVVGLGGSIRLHRKYRPGGTNADFVRKLGDQRLAMRVYERGVEDETLACGTGAVAVALISYLKALVHAPVEVCTRGNEVLTVSFEKKGAGFSDVFLEGGTAVIYQGELWDEALQ